MGLASFLSYADASTSVSQAEVASSLVCGAATLVFLGFLTRGKESLAHV